ncbi:MAG TPA: type II secretion system protein [Nitrospiria bacterium]
MGKLGSFTKFNLRTDEGFTLIELVLVIVILAFGITGVSAFFIQGAIDSSYAQLATIGMTLAQDQMEEIQSKCWDETETFTLPCDGPITPSFPLGPEGEGRSAFDDVDDFNGLSNSPPQDSQGTPMASFSRYTRTVGVCYVNAAALDVCVGGPTSFKRVSVIVSWGSAGDQIQLVTVVSHHS